MRKPDDLRREIEEKQAKERADLRDVLPQRIADRLDDYSKSIETALVEAFGSPEVPKELTDEMDAILKEIGKEAEENGYAEEIDARFTERLRLLAARVAAFKENPPDLAVFAVPEKGYVISYAATGGKKVERPMTVEESDMLFNMEMWADQCNQLKNTELFRKSLAHAKGATTRFEDPADRLRAVRQELYRKYEKFGFSRAQIDDLIILADEAELPEMVPEGEDPGMRKLEIMLDTWRKYLSDEEKSKYLKLATGIIVVGAAEGVTPAFLQKMMDSQTVDAAALFAAGYFGASSGLGWVRKKLSLDFDRFIDGLAQKEGGINERLSKDLVFQPGEKMAETQDRGKLMTAMRRSQAAFRDIISSMAKVTAPAIATSAAGIGIMMANDWRLGLMTMAGAPIAVAIAKRAQRKIEPIIEKSYEMEDKTALEVEEQINAHMEIVLSGMRDAMGPRLEAFLKKSSDLMHERTAARAGMEFQSGSVLNPAIIAGLTAAGVAMRGMGVQESGNIVAALVYSGMFRESFDTVVRQQAYMLESCKSIVEMEEVFNGYADEEEAADAKRIPATELPDFAIALKGVSLELGDRKIVDGVSVSIPAGGVVQIAGMSGHGKTTLMKLMAGYYRPTGGEVRLGGKNVNDIKKTGPESVYANIAYLSQFPYVFDSGDLRENLRFGNEADDGEMWRVLRELGLEERFSVKGKIDLSSKVVGLSGGERRRIGLARILLKMRAQQNGGVVFLDEPTEGLDAKTEDEFMDVLVKEKRAHPKLTFVVVSHKDRFIEGIQQVRGGEPGLPVQRIRLERGRVKE